MIKEAILYEKKEAEEVECYLCAHKCRIASGQLGFCRVRKKPGAIALTLSFLL